MKELFDELLPSIKTPAFIYNERDILEKINGFSAIIDRSQCSLLFPLKTFSVFDALHFMSPLVDGFSASSLFEAKLAREILGRGKSVHMVTPGLRPGEFDAILDQCTCVIFNSIPQWKAYRQKIASSTALAGLRVNPQLSFVKDERDNPCRKHSKLGIPLYHFLKEDREIFHGITGLHFHTNSESADFNQLLETVQQIESHLGDIFNQIRWINMGGGYLYRYSSNIDALRQTIRHVRDRYNLHIFFEPGKGIIGESGYIVATVLDLFESDGKNVAVLDTAVNHMPEVFEYQNTPRVMGQTESGPYSYILAGSTCLAGDLFGEYRFEQPLSAGSKVVFWDMGAYTMVKANLFNGINLPNIYACTADGKLELKKEYGFEEFRLRTGSRMPRVCP